MYRLALVSALVLALFAGFGCSSAKESGNGNASADPTDSSAKANTAPKTNEPKPPSMSKHEQTYQSLLPDKPGTVEEHTSFKIGDWRFFQKVTTNRPGGAKYQAAVDGQGNAVGGLVNANSWHAFLTTEGLDADKAHHAIAWLYGRAPVTKTNPRIVKDEKAKAALEDPVLTVNDSGASFRGWVIKPPHDLDPLLIVIDAPASGEATVTRTPWNEAQ